MELVTKARGYPITKVADLNGGDWLAVATDSDDIIHYLKYSENECMTVDSWELDEVADSFWDAVPKKVEMVVGIYSTPLGAVCAAEPRKVCHLFSGDIMPAGSKHLGDFKYVV